MYIETDEDLFDQAIEVMELLEDSVEYICDDQKLSGEKVWTMIHELSLAKLQQFPSYDD
jgi:hypothetical protein